MRKPIISRHMQDVKATDKDRLDLENLAQVELTSEDEAHPFESALKHGRGSGWRASEPGPQLVRLLFDEPLHIRHIHLVFDEVERTRTQEFLLRWSADEGRSYRDVVRQQYNFSPPNQTREIEDYEVNLVGVTILEIDISPDISGGDARASIAELHLS